MEECIMTYEMPMKKNNARRNVMSGARAGMTPTASASLSRVPSGASARPMSYPRMQSTKNSVTRGRRDVPMHKSGTQKIAYAAGGALVALHDAAVHFARDTKKHENYYTICFYPIIISSTLPFRTTKRCRERTGF